jgi:hypothetical protein
MPQDLRLRTPALFVAADFNCQRVPVCLPERRSSPPDPRGPGNKDEDFQRVRAAGLDTMKIALRAATHLDFTEFPQANGSRYGVVTTFYYTLAWFDRYLRGRGDALRRLIAGRFDDSADVHNVSGGRYDPATGGNQLRPNRPRLRFKLRGPRGQRVVAVRAYLDGRRVLRRRGRRLRAVVVSLDPSRRSFRVRIVARTNVGARVVIKTRYRDCKRGRTTVRLKRSRRRGARPPLRAGGPRRRASPRSRR